MAYRASTYRPGIEDEPNPPAIRSARERSPRRNGRRSPRREASAGQGPKRLDRSENRSRSLDRSSPISGIRRMSEIEKKKREYENYGRELRAKEALEWKKDIAEKSGERRPLDVQLKEVNDRERDQFQAAIHAQIGAYVDELIRDGWQGGEKVTKESSPRFAAEVLVHVRKRFYTEVARNEAAARTAGHDPKLDPPNGPYTQKLVLENMRWVCDTKIKPLTDQYGKELFLCNGCENHHRLYSFESVLQHYAAKHTSALSIGTIVVHWGAEWPEHPPFNPDPDAAMNTFHSVVPSNTMSANGALTSTRGFGGYTENKELEKRKREREIREREIQIKEAKEEIERKEREKAKREYEYKERQTRAAEAAERKKRELEDQERESHANEAATYKEPLSNNQSGGGGASSLQQNGRSLQDIHNIPQTDRTITTEQPERSTLPQPRSNSDSETRPLSPSTRSVEMGNMDSNSSDLRASQRLHLAGLFTRFMSEVSEQTALQLQRESAKKTLEQKTAAYDKAQVLHKEFPSAEESTRASKERALKEFEKVERKLIKKREASMKLSEEISEIVYPEEEPSDSDRDIASKIKHLEDKLAQFQADSELVKNKQQQLDQLYSTLVTEKDKQIILDSIGNGFSSVRQEVSAYAAKTSSLEVEIAQLKQRPAPTDVRSSFEGLSLRIDGLEQRKASEDTVGLKSTIETLSSRVDELQHARHLVAELGPRNLDEATTALRSTMDNLSSRIDGLEAIKLKLTKAVETIKSDLALQLATINDRSEIKSVHSSMKSLSRSEGEIRAGLAKLQTQMQALGKDLRTIKMVERGRRPSDASFSDINGLSKGLRIAIHDEIRAQQEAVDVVLDEKFGSLEELLGQLKGQLNPLAIQSAEVDGSLNSFRNQYAAQIDGITTDLVGVRGDINSTREEINRLKQNDMHSLHLACNNLDYRMNNLSTEHLARQILGQLDAHIRGGEKNIATLELRMQELERRAANGEGSTISKREVEESLKRVRKELVDAVDERLDKVKDIFVDLNNDLVKEQMQLRTEMDTNHSKWQNVRADVEASKTDIAEAMGPLRTEVDSLSSKTQIIQEDLSASKIEFTQATKSLRAEVDRIGPTLQTVQDDLGATKTSCKEATASLKVEIAKATKTISPEKRQIDSPGPIKTNGHKRRRQKRSISDSDDDA